MATAATNDTNARALLTVNASGGQNTISWSASVTDNNASFGGFGDSGFWNVTIGPYVVVNASGAYDFGANSPAQYFPRSESGTLTGVPAGTYTVTGTFRGNVGSTIVGTATIAAFNVFVSDPPPPPPAPTAVSVESLSRSANGQDISLTSSTSSFSGSGGYYQWRWSYDNASWSAGITMSGRSGSGSGFSSANTIYVQVIAIDSAGNSGWSGSASIAGISAPSWSTGTALSAATRGSAYSATVIASPSTGYSLVSQSGGTGTYTVTNNGSSATISGTPTATGTASVTVRAANYDRTTDRTFTFTVRPALPVFSDASVNSSARVGVAYSDAVAASETASYSVFSGALPGGLSLNTSTGAITGTPTTPGTFNFVIRATNVTGSTNTGTLTITVISSARVWNGSAFVVAQARVWNGSAFVTGTIKVWDGTTWRNTN